MPYRNPGQLGISRSATNMKLVPVDNWSVVPDNTYIWNEDQGLPFYAGMTFPTEFIEDRGSLFNANDLAYKGEYAELYNDILFNLNDYMRDAITNQPILQLVPNLPDHRVITETWVDLLAAKPPKIDGGDDEKIVSVSSIVGSSNFPTAYQNIVREALIMYGNAAVRIDKQRGGNPKIIPMPIKSWIPFVNEQDLTAIDVNCFFNIFVAREGQKIGDDYVAVGGEDFCEFVLYYEDGRVEKVIFEYLQESKTLGDEFYRVTSQAFGGKGVSPIVVFQGDFIGNTVYGENAYKKWDSAIASSMRAYQTVLILLERTKEIIRVLPRKALRRDESTGSNYEIQTGTISYDKEAPKVEAVVPDIPMEEALKAYSETLKRLSLDSGLAYAIFDSREFGTQMSAKALKTLMYRTELQAKSMNTKITMALKMLIVKLALTKDIEIGVNEFSLLNESGFVQDLETLATIIKSRIPKDAATMSVPDAISRLDDVTMAEARASARALQGLSAEEVEESSTTDSGDESVVSELNLTHGSTADADSSSGGNPSSLDYYPMGGGNLDGKTQVRKS